MAFTDRHAPDDTAIKPENMAENIDVKGVGRYYPEEHGGQIQAIQNRGQLIADVPKTLAGIVLNYDEHALSTWKANQEIQLHDKYTLNNLLLSNRKQQMELSTDLELYDAQKELESQIFQARKNAETLGKVSEEQAVNEVLDNFKDKFQGRLVPDSKWQGILQNIGRENLAKARISDWETSTAWADASIQNEFNTVYNSVIGIAQNPDGTLQPMMSIAEGMSEFTKRIASLINHIPIQKRPQIFQQYFNALVAGQAQALVELYHTGDLSADSLMTQLAGLREEFGGKTLSCPLVDENGKPLKDSNDNDMIVDLSLDTTVDLFLIKGYKEAKSGIGNGGEQIASNAIDDFKQAIGWSDIESQGWSEQLLSYETPQLTDLFASQVVNISNSTATDDKKRKSISELSEIYNKCRMLNKVRDIVRQHGQEALPEIRRVIDEINDRLTTERATFNWQDYNGRLNIADGYDLGKPGVDEASKGVLLKQGIDMNLVAPKLGDTSEEAALYWDNMKNLLTKYADYMSKNSMGEVLYVTDNNFRQNADAVTNAFIPDKLFTYKNGVPADVIKTDSEQGKILQQNLQNIKKLAMNRGGRKYVPVPVIDSILDKVKGIEDTTLKYKASSFVDDIFNEAGLGSDLYAYAYEKLKQGKDDGGLLSVAALKNSRDGYEAFQYAIKDGTYANISRNIDKKIEQDKNLTAIANRVYEDLGISNKDINMHKQLVDFCAIAAYDSANDSIDNDQFKKYLRESLEGQYVSLKNPNILHKFNHTALQPTAFNGRAIHKNNPALAQYSGDMNRLYKIGERAYYVLRDSNLIPPYLRESLKGAVLTPDAETGMWHFTKGDTSFSFDGNKIGMIYDDPIFYATTNIDDILKFSVGTLVSALSMGRYNDYVKTHSNKPQKVIYETYKTNYNDDSKYKIKDIKYESTPLLTKEEFDKRNAVRFKAGMDLNKAKVILSNYSVNNKSGIKDIEQFTNANMEKY